MFRYPSHPGKRLWSRNDIILIIGFSLVHGNQADPPICCGIRINGSAAGRRAVHKIEIEAGHEVVSSTS